MRLTTIMLLSLAAACGEDDDLGPPPIDVYEDTWMSTGPPEPMRDESSSPSGSESSSTGEVPLTCEEFQSCTLDCSSLEFGETTQQLRTDCVADCRSPGGTENTEFFREWGLHCANSGDSEESATLCEDGLPVCSQLET